MDELKALILRECPYAYYIHCMAHQLQLALVAASREVHEVHNFFQNANFVINVVSASTKRSDELLANQAEEIAREIELGELDTGRGQNQIGTLQRPGDTRWSSHYKSIQSLKKMFAATVAVLRGIASDRSVSKYSRGDAVGSLKIVISFDFVFILHLMEKIMKITDVLCQKLQYKSLDILNAMDSVSNTKVLLGELREHGWDSLLEEVKSFCVKHEIDIPDLDRKYVFLLSKITELILSYILVAFYLENLADFVTKLIGMLMLPNLEISMTTQQRSTTTKSMFSVLQLINN